jgi:hypothetical protein
MLEINDNELASRLRMLMSRLLKIIRTEVRHDELLSLTERSTLLMVYQYPEILPSVLAAKEKHRPNLITTFLSISSSHINHIERNLE